MMKKVSWVLTLLILALGVLALINNREEKDTFLNDGLDALEGYFDQRDFKNVQVSQADVGWHLDHTLKTINRVVENMQISDPDDFEAKFNFQRLLVHTSGTIPRGVAQSPANVRPPQEVLLDSLHIQLREARKNIEEISRLDEKAFFSHPVFDNLDRDQARRFLKIHTNHHLKIIRDILEEE